METMLLKPQLAALLHQGDIRVVTDHGTVAIKDLPCTVTDAVAVYDAPFAKITVSVLDKGGDTLYRGIMLRCKEDLTLFRIDFITDFPVAIENFINYRSFIDAPAAAFLRFERFGYYAGVENPFFSANVEKNSLILSYEPSLLLKSGEIYESEPQFIGSYSQTFEYIKEKSPINIEAVTKGIKRSRFFNPCGEIPLDLAEIDAMRQYVTEYYDVIEKGFDNILYFFFYPKKQLPETDTEIRDYLDTVDRFAEMSGDIIAFNPHYNTKVPTAEMPYWELAPIGSPAEKILQHTKDKGLRAGYYMGCAFNGDGGNAALLPFMPEKTDWKKVDAFGNTATENCLACDDYLDWWFTVQKNTIEKYDLGYWSWDPGPGNGNDCYAENHGHIPGKGEYKGWRNSMKLLKKIKDTFPSLFLMSFYGRKEYGIWGFRYFSQHEVYWEQTILFGATLHNDLHDDRVNAHGTRLQNQWCMNFRFTPAHIGHGLVPRMGESFFDPTLDRAYDFGGFRYALLSAIACCGSATHCNLPDKLENVPGYAAFYQKWIRWAKDNYRYCAFTKPIGDEVSNNLIDGFARIDRDNGQIFLFNSSPKILNKKLPLDKKLGLDTNKSFYLRFLYCENTDFEEKEIQYGGVYHMGDLLDITLPPYGAVVFEITSTPAEQTVDQIPRNVHTIDRFTDENGQEFSYPVHSAAEHITLTTEAVFTSELKALLDASHIAGEEFLMEKLPQWRKDGMMPFTLTSALPYRLVMYIPFDGAKQPSDVKLKLNGTEVPVENFRLWETVVARYAFLEDFIHWDETNTITLEISNLAENSFMGIHVDYPDAVNGIRAEEKIFSEHPEESPLHSDPSLVIDSFTLTPDVLSDLDTPFTVTVKTKVDPNKIEGVYFLHPTIAQMPALAYDPDKDAWIGQYSTGVRSHNIFCNSRITARIHGKDGGIGPAAEAFITIRYDSGK